MKRILTLLFSLILIVSAVGCDKDIKPANYNVNSTVCKHEWQEANCKNPKICKICGVTDGYPLKHLSSTDNCEQDIICERCGEIIHKAFPHTFEEATCKSPKHCLLCEYSEGEPTSDHDFTEATCKTPKTCKICGKTSGKPSDKHNYSEATCTTPKTCKVCGKTSGKTVDHKLKNHYCVYCGKYIFKIKNSGYGDTAISKIDLGESGLKIIRFKHSGRRNVIVYGYDSNGNKELLINGIGNYDGTVLIPFNGNMILNIEADGSWEYTITELSTTTKTSFSGAGDFVTPIFSENIQGVWKITHDGKRNFIVYIYTNSDSDLVVNDIGSYSGTKYIDISGSGAFFEISADGNWSIEPVN